MAGSYIAMLQMQPDLMRTREGRALFALSRKMISGTYREQDLYPTAENHRNRKDKAFLEKTLDGVKNK